MMKRSECHCLCHNCQPGLEVVHCVPCCYPDGPQGFEFDTISEAISRCPNCDGVIVYPAQESCNECEVCFCGENCRTEFHLLHKIEHDYNKPLEDLS